MKNTRLLEQGLVRVLRVWSDGRYDTALSDVEDLLRSWPGNAQLTIMWASLVQLQENPTHTLDEVKKALQRAVALDRNSPAGPIELGHLLDAVEDNPRAASRAFAAGIRAARRLLIEGLLGQARCMLEMKKKKAALQCLMEALYLANNEASADGGAFPATTPDILLRDLTGNIQAFQLKGPFALKVEDLLRELFPKRSA